MYTYKVQPESLGIKLNLNCPFYRVHFKIYERVWNERAINTDTVMVHVRNIREKIEYNPKEPKYLKVVWGVGYKIEKNA